MSQSRVSLKTLARRSGGLFHFQGYLKINLVIVTEGKKRAGRNGTARVNWQRDLT